jgi:hypothetical protein
MTTTANRTRPATASPTAPHPEATTAPRGAGPPQPAATVGQRRLLLTPASAIEPEPVVWAWTDQGQGRIPAGALSLAAGREGTGKSSFGIWLAAHLTRGTLPGAFHGRPAAIIYAAVEDSWRHTLVPRMVAAGADLHRVLRVDVTADQAHTGTLCLPLDNRLLEQAIRDHNVALVVMDPLMSMISEQVDTHRERQTRTVLDSLNALAERTGAVVLGIAHFSKARGTDASSLITASAAFRNVPRAIFGFAHDPHNGAHVMSQTKSSLGRPDLPSLAYTIEATTIPTAKGPASVARFTLLGTSDRHVSDILAASLNNGHDEDERRDATTWLAAYLADNGGHAQAVDVLRAGQKVGFSKHTLNRAKKRARVASHKDGIHTGWTWMLNPDPPTRPAATPP